MKAQKLIVSCFYNEEGESIYATLAFCGLLVDAH